jgi:hypothetical protein
LQRLVLTNMRLERVARLAILASRTVINTCFRRGYTVSRLKYCVLAAGASIVPLLDEVPSFAGREKIRQAFGIHDRWSISNAIRRKTNSLEEYLTKYQLTMPEGLLQSGYFGYTVSKGKKGTASSLEDHGDESPQLQPSAHKQSMNTLSQMLEQKQVGAVFQGGNIIKQSMVVGGVAVQSVDDILRIVAPSAAGALRGLSIAGLVVGVVLLPFFAAWSAYSAGKRMKRHLHLLCDDLQIIFVYLIIRICDGYHANRSRPNLSSQ